MAASLLRLPKKFNFADVAVKRRCFFATFSALMFQMKLLDGFSHFVDREHVISHVFNATHYGNSTLHIEVNTQEASKR